MFPCLKHVFFTSGSNRQIYGQVQRGKQIYNGAHKYLNRGDKRKQVGRQTGRGSLCCSPAHRCSTLTAISQLKYQIGDSLCANLWTRANVYVRKGRLFSSFHWMRTRRKEEKQSCTSDMSRSRESSGADRRQYGADRTHDRPASREETFRSGTFRSDSLWNELHQSELGAVTDEGYLIWLD